MISFGSTPSPLSSEPFKVIETGHGRVIEDLSGFRYSLSSKRQQGTISWRCSRKAKGCKAYVVTLNDLIIQKKYLVGMHSRHFMAIVSQPNDFI